MGPGKIHIVFIPCLSFIVCLLADPLHGSPLSGYSGSGPQFITEQWTTSNGLPINHINQVHQTPDGFIWLATFSGLVRFDGVEFKLFDTANTERLPSNRLVKIHADLGNAFWVTTEQGDRVRVENGTFTLFPEIHSLRKVAIFPDEATSTTWIGAETGLYIFEDSSLTPVRPDLFDGVRVVTLYRRASGEFLIIAEKSGIKMFLFPDGDITNEPIMVNSPENYSAFIEDEAGRLWMARDGIAYLDGNTIIEVEADPGLTAMRRFDVPFIHNFKRDRNGAILVSSQIGLMKLENGMLTGVDVSEPTGVTTRSRMEGSDITTCADGSVWSFNQNRIYKNGFFEFEADHPVDTILCDLESNLWFSSDRNGLLRYRPSLFDTITFGYSENNFYGVYQDAYDVTWIGAMHSELNVIDRNGKARTLLFPEDMGTTAVFAGLNDGSLLVGNQRCLPAYRTESGVCSSFSTVEPLRYENIRAILQQRDGTIWAGSPNALIKMRMDETGTITMVEQLPELRVRYMLESESGDLWFATNGDGVLRFSHGERVRYRTGNGLSSNNIRALYEDNSGHIWVASEDRGLNRINPVTGEIAIIRKTDGLYDDGLHKMVVDRFGRMWMSTNHGIFRVDMDQLQEFADGNLQRVSSIAYTERDGMLNREANGGFQNSGFKATDGRIYFATQNGVVVIDPERIAHYSPIPSVILENLVAGSERFSPADATTNLGSNQRSFSIQYTSPFFTAPDRVRFRYKLEGFDPDWNDAGSRRQAIYTNIPAGRYQFHVKADLGNEESASSVTSHAIVISPNFFETRWFPFFMTLLIVLIIAGGYRLRLRHLIRKEKMLENIIESRTNDLRSEKNRTEEQAEQLRLLSQEKNRFFANISHEFRTPLTLITGQVEALLVDESSRYKKQKLYSLNRNAERLLDLINQLLDLSKLEDGKMTLEPGRHNLVTFLKNLFFSFESLADSKNIQLNFFSPVASLFMEFDADKMERVFLNLFSNALKFTPNGGHIDVMIENREPGFVEIGIKDSGIGISAEHLPHIFDRFYQVNMSDTRKFEGTGIGLALVRELVKLHNGSISVCSQIGEGTGFVVKLPCEEKPAMEQNDPDHAVTAVVESEPALPLPDYDSLIAQNGEIILIVEDNTDVRQFIREQLEQEYTVLEAGNGMDGLEKARITIPDLIISDLMMPEMDGFRFSAGIRSDEKTSHIPIIMLTAKAGLDPKIEGLEAGIDAWLTKPFHVRELHTRVRTLIQQRKNLKKQFSSATYFKASAFPGNPVDQTFLKNAIEMVERHFVDEAFIVDQLAESLNMSVSQLNRKLKALVDQPAGTFIRSVKLQRSVELLNQTDKTVAEICYEVGFNDQAYFSRAFKKQFGKSPSAFRKLSV